MKLLIVFIMALACAHAIFPKLVLEFSEEEDEGFIKIPKLNLFPKPLLFEKLIKKKEKMEALFEKKLAKLEAKLLDKEPPPPLPPVPPVVPPPPVPPLVPPPPLPPLVPPPPLPPVPPLVPPPPVPPLPADVFALTLLSVLDEKPKAKLVYEKLAEFHPDPPPPCDCSPPDDCEFAFFT